MPGRLSKVKTKNNAEIRAGTREYYDFEEFLYKISRTFNKQSESNFNFFLINRVLPHT